MKTLSIVIAGVGGQGTLLASRILGALGTDEGFQVKVSEVHGMSQRGGSVITYVRIGDEVFSPLVEYGGADYVLAFERLEALRGLPYLKKDGTMVLNTQIIPPMSVITGASAYPEGILERLRASVRTVELPAFEIAEKVGEARAVNLALLGKLSTLLPFSNDAWIRAIRGCVAERFMNANLSAFEYGKAEVC